MRAGRRTVQTTRDHRRDGRSADGQRNDRQHNDRDGGPIGRRGWVSPPVAMACVALVVLVSCASDDAGAGADAAARADTGADTGATSSALDAPLTETADEQADELPDEAPTSSVPTSSPLASGATRTPATVCDPALDATVEPGLVTRVTVWQSLGGDQAFDAFDALVAEFEAAHPNIDIDDVRIEGYTSALERLRTASADEFPDLFMGPIDTARLLAESDLFVPPSACWGGDPPVLDDLLPVIRAAVTIDDVVWSYPFNISTPVLVYDRTMFADAGLDPDVPPATPEELRGALETIVATGAATGGLAMYDRSGSWLIDQWAVDHGHVLAVPDNGARDGVAESFSFASDEAVLALEWAREMYADGLIDWRGTNESGLDDLLALIDLDQGRTAVTLHTSAALGDIAWLVDQSGIEGIGDAELGVAPLPTPSGGAGALVGGGSLWLLDHSDPLATGAAARFAEFLMSPSSQGAFAAATGYVPATASASVSAEVAELWSQFPQLAVPYRQVEAQSVSPAALGMQIGPRVEVQRVLELAAADVIVVGLGARERLERAEQEAMEIFRLYTGAIGDADERE